MTAPPNVAIARALDAAGLSPCAKSQRGVVAYVTGTDGSPQVISRGFNGPPGLLPCDGSPSCRTDCAKRCVHAESRAVRDLVHHRTPQRIHLVHVKAVDGELVAGAGPSCWQCSREILDIGIGGVWLYEAQRWHDEVPCDTCNLKTIIAQGAGTDCVCSRCKSAGRHPGLLELARGKTIYAPDSGEWRFYSADEFHRTTLVECGIGGPR